MLKKQICETYRVLKTRYAERQVIMLKTWYAKDQAMAPWPWAKPRPWTVASPCATACTKPCCVVYFTEKLWTTKHVQHTSAQPANMLHHR